MGTSPLTLFSPSCHRISPAGASEPDTVRQDNAMPNGRAIRSAKFQSNLRILFRKCLGGTATNHFATFFHQVYIQIRFLFPNLVCQADIITTITAWHKKTCKSAWLVTSLTVKQPPVGGSFTALPAANTQPPKLQAPGVKLSSLRMLKRKPFTRKPSTWNDNLFFVASVITKSSPTSV